MASCGKGQLAQCYKLSKRNFSKYFRTNILLQEEAKCSNYIRSKDQKGFATKSSSGLGTTLVQNVDTVPSRRRDFNRQAEKDQDEACGNDSIETRGSGTDSHSLLQQRLVSGPKLSDFMMCYVNFEGKATETENGDKETNQTEGSVSVPYLSPDVFHGRKKKVYFQVYGCQMNTSDTEVAWSILQKNGYQRTNDVREADVILVMTCAIREGAEDKVWSRLEFFKSLKRKRKWRKEAPVTIGILGCMAERLKQQIVEKEGLVDVVCGPDAYRDLPHLLASSVSTGRAAVNVQLSLEETYADIVPVRYSSSPYSAYVSIMRGCDNMCTYCIVPFTRGRERSRPISSILEEVKKLSDEGVKEVTLLGQNVNSYRDTSEDTSFGGYDKGSLTAMSRGFNTVYKPKTGGRRFADLLDSVSRVNPEMRVWFTSPHPKDFPDEVLHLIRERANVLRLLHLPAQSGSDAVLKAMGRGYTRQAYLDLVQHIRSIIPDIAFTSDFISGFCGETEADHQDTVSLIHQVQYDFAYCYPYSMRQKTRAYHRLKDDVAEDVKKRRYMELVTAFREESEKLHAAQIGSKQLVMVEGVSKRSDKDWAGRNEAKTKVIFPKTDLPGHRNTTELRPVTPGDYIAVQVVNGNSQILRAVPLYHTTLQDFWNHQASYSSDCFQESVL